MNINNYFVLCFQIKNGITTAYTVEHLKGDHSKLWIISHNTQNIHTSTEFTVVILPEIYSCLIPQFRN